MSWRDRLKEAAYISPSGTRITFDYRDVSRLLQKKTTSFEFPDADGSFVQDLGRAGRRYPLRVSFSGTDYDLVTPIFESALEEKGVGVLEHPLYGTVNVVPFGRITRRDALVTAGNQAIIEVTFFETIKLIYPQSQRDPGSEIAQAINAYNETSSNEFGEEMSVGTTFERVSLQNEYKRLQGFARNVLSPIANSQDDTRRRFDAIFDSINASIVLLTSTPGILAAQNNLFVQAPARARTPILTRISAYQSLIDGIVNEPTSVKTKTFSTIPPNQFHTDDLFASGYVTAVVVSVINHKFANKPEAIEAADTLLKQFGQVNNWRDENFKSLEIIDEGASYQKLQDAVALTAGFLVELSFTLPQERSLLLERPRTIVDLSAELYGEVDDTQLNFFINSNNLTGNEILELPRGREIVYYV